jgi:hypothetical protein
MKKAEGNNEVMKIDNFSVVQPLLEFGKDTYYFVQIIKRRKDEGNEGMGVSELCLWQRFIDRPETLDRMKQEIQELCTIYNARAYIELNPRSLERWSIELTRKLLDRISLHDFTSVQRLPNKVALSEETIKTRGLKGIDRRRWMLDIDEKTTIPIADRWITEQGIRKVATIPTLSGAHIIIESFNYKRAGLKLGGKVEIEGTKFILSPTANTLLYC